MHLINFQLVYMCVSLRRDIDTVVLLQSEWQTSEKKKKKPPAAAGNGEPEAPRDRDARDPRDRTGPPRTREYTNNGTPLFFFFVSFVSLRDSLVTRLEKIYSLSSLTHYHKN